MADPRDVTGNAEEEEDNTQVSSDDVYSKSFHSQV